MLFKKRSCYFMYSSDFLKPLIFILLIIAVTGTGIYITTPEQETAVVVRNGTIPLLPLVGRALPLKQAMSKDKVLEDYVLDLGGRDKVRIFADYGAVDYLVSNILLRWTGSHLIASDARGSYIDARLVDFLEKTGEANALPQQITDAETARQIQTLWYNAFQKYKTKLLLQTSARDMFVGSAGYDIQADRAYVNGPLSSRAVTEIIDLMPYSQSPKGMYNNFLVFVRFSRGLDKLTEEEKIVLRRMRDEANRLSAG